MEKLKILSLTKQVDWINQIPMFLYSALFYNACLTCHVNSNFIKKGAKKFNQEDFCNSAKLINQPIAPFW